MFAVGQLRCCTGITLTYLSGIVVLKKHRTKKYLISVIFQLFVFFRI